MEINEAIKIILRELSTGEMGGPSSKVGIYVRYPTASFDDSKELGLAIETLQNFVESE